MRITFAPRGILQIDDARIIFTNFTGAASKFNRDGERNFHVVIDDQETADRLIEEGWNLRIRPANEEGEPPFITLKVKVKFNERGPSVYLKSGDKMLELDEDSVSMLDNIDIAGVDLDVRPYDWEVNGDTGRTAYLQSIHVVQEIDRFKARYED